MRGAGSAQSGLSSSSGSVSLPIGGRFADPCSARANTGFPTEKAPVATTAAAMADLQRIIVTDEPLVARYAVVERAGRQIVFLGQPVIPGGTAVPGGLSCRLDQSRRDAPAARLGSGEQVLEVADLAQPAVRVEEVVREADQL